MRTDAARAGSPAQRQQNVPEWQRNSSGIPAFTAFTRPRPAATASCASGHQQHGALQCRHRLCWLLVCLTASSIVLCTYSSLSCAAGVLAQHPGRLWQLDRHEVCSGDAKQHHDSACFSMQCACTINSSCHLDQCVSCPAGNTQDCSQPRPWSVARSPAKDASKTRAPRMPRMRSGA